MGAPAEAGIRPVMIGTAGHIDHGKSSVVRRLTGVDPDRLAEERERGMTIDLGFAPYDHGSGTQVGLIDVPGHERFIKNMVAGATSVDVVMLVVAADDGVMPQTVEHLQILELLGARRGLVVVTKIDLVDGDLLELVLEDVRGLVAGTVLDGAPVLPVACPTGEGFETLRRELDALVGAVPPRRTGGPFRLPIQRVFSAKGHGTVVTGVPVSGEVAPGDVLEVVGSGRQVRVRGVQAFGRERERARAGHSTALNVSGISKDEVRRGDVVARPGVFGARRRLLAVYRHVEETDTLANAQPVRLHVGTSEVMGRCVLLDADHLAPGDEGFVQVRLDEPVVAVPGDRYLLRHASTMVVLGGGEVLGATDGRLKRLKDYVLEDARRRRQAGDDARAWISALLEQRGRRGAGVDELVVECGRSPDEVRAALAELVAEGSAVALGADDHVDAGALAAVAEDVLAQVKHAHKAHPLREWLDITWIRRGLDLREAVLRAAIESHRRLETAPGGRVRRRGYRPQLSAAQRDARALIAEELDAGGAAPPALGPERTGLSRAEHDALVGMLREAGEVVWIDGHLFAPAAIDRVREALVEHARARDGRIDIPSFRDEIGTTRKYLIPLLEHFDAEGLTVRRGANRMLRHRNVTS